MLYIVILLTPHCGVCYDISVKTNIQRLNNVSGQITGVKKMMEEGDDCVAVLTQLKAVQSAVSKIIEGVVEEQFEKCMNSLTHNDKELLIKLKKYVKSN